MGWCAILFAGSFIPFLAVSAGKSDILINTTTEPWMSRENFSSLIDVSFNVRQCVNIFICDKSAETERLFKEFISIYPFSYILNDTHHDCNNYFMVSKTEEKFLHAFAYVLDINAKFEILIVIDNDIGEPIAIKDDDFFSVTVFKVWLYFQSNVNVAAQNGLWTLSDNYLSPRVFKKVSRYDAMKHKTGVVDLNGAEMHATTFYNPPLCFLQTTVNETDYWGDPIEYFVAEDESERDGVELKLFFLFAERLNFTYRIRKPKDNERYGRRNGSYWQGGVIGEMFKATTQIAFGGIWLTAEYYEVTPLTSPWRQLHLNFLVPRPKPHASFWALTTPLSPEVWAAVFAMLTAQSVCVYTRAWVNPRIPKRFRSFTKTWTEMMARLLGTWAPRKIQCLKLQLQLWHFIGVLMVTAYSSSLAARLASRDYDKRIDTLKDFIAANLTWGREGPTAPFSSYLDMSDPYAKQFPDRYEHETSEAERHEKILKGNYAILGNLVASAFFPHNLIRNEDLTGYRLMKESIGDYYATFAVELELLDSVNMILLWMQETGLVQYHLNDVLHRRMSFALREVLIERDVNNGEPRVLELTPLGAGFSLYLVCMFISTIVFCLELRSVRGSRSIREVLLDIKKNREIWQAKEAKRNRVRSLFMKLKEKRHGFDRPRKNEWMEGLRRRQCVHF